MCNQRIPFHKIWIFIIFLIQFLITSLYCSIAYSAGIPDAGTGIWAQAIGDFGQLKKTEISIYVLDERSFEKYCKTKNYKIEPKGTSPLLIKNLDIGNYYIGFEIIIDKKIVKPEKYKVDSPIPSQGMRLVPENYFANDLPIIYSKGLKVVSINGAYSGEYYYIKWYKTAVKKNEISPVTSIFIKKNTQLVDLKNVYPKKYLYQLKSKDRELHSFWRALEEFNIKYGKKDRKALLNLLKKGGVVCLPSDKAFDVIKIDSDGEIMAEASVKNLDRNISIKPITPIKDYNEKIASQEKGLIENKIISKFPSFTYSLDGKNELRIINPNNFKVYAAVRSGAKGKNFYINAKSKNSIWVPNGRFEIFFIYSKNPDYLYKGDNFILNNKGIEIEIVSVSGGNYTIRRVE